MAVPLEEIIVRSIRDLNGVLIGGTPALPGLAAPGVLSFMVDGGGAVIAAGVVGDITVSFPGVLTSWTLLADQVGSCTIDIWKETYANYPPLVADSITAAAKPAITAGNAKGQSAALTGWTTSFAAGDTFRFNVDALLTITRFTLSLTFYRT